jgi:hypothetical protein
MWVHAHQHDLHVVWSAASEAQHRSLAAALHLNYDLHAKSEAWHTMIVRKVLSCIAPGATPEKRKAPDGRLEGQIHVPGHDAARQDPSPEKATKKPKSKPSAKSKKRPASSDSSADSDVSSSSSDNGAPPAVVDLDPPATLDRMPTLLGSGAAFASLVAAKCRRSWVATAVIEAEIPASARGHFFRGKMWENAERRKYDKMIAQQRSASGRAQRRENPNRVACPHRLTFAYSNDDELTLEASHLVMVCSGESLSDFTGEAGRAFGGLRARADYTFMTSALRAAWADLTGAVGRDENIGAPAVTAIFDLVYSFLERRYARFATILTPGRLREEVLANVARQLAELSIYFASFTRSLADRCSRRPYAELAQYAGSRYIRLLGPAVHFLLDVDGASPALHGPAPVPAAAGGGGAGGGHVVATPPAARRKVAFADGGAAEHFASPPSLTQAPGPGQGGWPGVPHYATHPAAYYPPTGAAFAPPMAPFSPTPAGGQGWSGYAGPVTSAPPAAVVLPPPTSSPPVFRPAIKPEAAPPASGKEPFLGQPQHIYLTGPGYNAVPAGEVRVPPCGCGSKHGAGYRPGPHATWDCPFRYMA